MKTAIYARKSTSKLGQKETIDNQIKICKRRAKELGLEIVDIKTDTGTGSDDLSRPEVKELIADAVSGKYDCVIMKGISRLYRDTEKGLGLIKRLDRSDIRVITVEENFDSHEHRTGGSIDTSRITMYLMFAEMEVKKLSERVKHTQVEKAHAGEWNQANNAPIGYKYNPDTKKLAIDYSTMPIVKLIFNLYLDGLGMKSIAHYLNGDNPEGRVYPSPKSKRWNEHTVGYVLKNQAYCGDVVYNKRSKKARPYKNPEMLGKTDEDVYVGNDYNTKDKWIITENAHESIIDRETFEKVQTMIGTKAARKGIKNNISLLAGILKCGKCESGMTFKRGRKNDKGWIVTKDNYYCLNYIRYGKNFCTSHHVGADEIEKKILEFIRTTISGMLDKNKIMSSTTKKPNPISKIQRDITKIEKSIEMVTKKMDTILEKNIEGNMSDAQYNVMNEKYSAELTLLTDQLATLKIKEVNSTEDNDNNDRLDKIYDELLDFENFSKEKQRYLLLDLIESATINDGKLVIKTKY